ncbi:MAG: serine/threonine protein phosphatase, partial [Desulfovibrionaceae bacterium]|nr:serine/threonine protein phosphatase [Desulfovibrionaceae bacterium]
MYWIAFGDIHENIAAALRIPGLARAEAVIVTGDWTNRGGRLAVQALYRSIEALNPRILAQLGNMDTQAVADYLREQGADIHLKARELAPGVGIMGVGCSAPTPFATPSEVEDRQLDVWLRQTFELARGF